MSNPDQLTKECIVGRLAPRRWQEGDAVPAVGSVCLVSGANSNVESDQHRGFYWRRVIGYANGHQFVCLQTTDCWPTVERMENCWFAEIPTPAVAPTEAAAMAATVPARSEQQIVDQTETLADMLMKAFHRREKADPLSTYRGTQDTRARQCWLMACEIQEMLTDTDPENAASEVDDLAPIEQPAAQSPDSGAGPVITEAMVDAYLKAQAAKVQEVDNMWGGKTGKAAEYLHPVRDACRAGLAAALAQQGAQNG